MRNLWRIPTGTGSNVPRYERAGEQRHCETFMCSKCRVAVEIYGEFFPSSNQYRLGADCEVCGGSAEVIVDAEWLDDLPRTPYGIEEQEVFKELKKAHAKSAHGTHEVRLHLNLKHKYPDGIPEPPPQPIVVVKKRLRSAAGVKLQSIGGSNGDAT